MLFIFVLEAGFADIVRAFVVRQQFFRFALEFIELALIDAPDMTDHMRKLFALRVLSEQCVATGVSTIAAPR